MKRYIKHLMKGAEIRTDNFLSCLLYTSDAADE